MNKCSKCGITKQVSEFNKNARSKNGLQHWCKTCKRKHAVEFDREEQMVRNAEFDHLQSLINTSTHKYCKCCQVPKLFSDFNKRSCLSSGLSNICKQCISIKRKRNTVRKPIVSEKIRQEISLHILNNNMPVDVLWDGCIRDEKSRLILLVKCLKDGYQKMVTVGNFLRSKSILCPNCIDTKYNTKLQKTGFSLVSREGMNCTILCNTCGSVQSLHSRNVFSDNNHYCASCSELKSAQILKECGCKFIKRIPGKRNLQGRIVYEDSDGYIKNVTEISIQYRQFSINSQSHWSRPCSVYIFVSNNSNYPFLKIGTASVPHNRLKTLKLTFDCSVISYEFKSRYVADRIESFLHNKFKVNSINKELIEVCTGKLRSVPRSDGKVGKDGASEWFSISILPEVLSLMQNGEVLLNNKENSHDSDN